MEKRKTGFTLIETLVGMSIIAIIVVCAFSAGSDMIWVSHEAEYHNALRLLKQNSAVIGAAGTDSLPPETVKIPSSGKVQLSHSDIVQGSLTVIDSEKNEILPGDYSTDHEHGVISFHPGTYTGKQVVIKYTFNIPDTGELCRVPSKAPFKVAAVNYPTKRIVKIEVLSGGTGTAVSENLYRLSKDGSIIFDPSLAGKCVRITGCGGTVRSQCTGKFLTPETLAESAAPTDIKLIKIREVYGAGNNFLETINMRFREVKDAKPAH
ncbi:MAG: prepilin-type N-terminal cleavage/methylation domain-containing protein [Firmicutes bacterium]|nr:prepilin-type N-terminal cleavage/methylation domain-containing protein [Bacillota bacterium]